MTFTSRRFNQDTGSAKKAAQSEPVFITDRGRPSHVLLSIEAYRKLTGTGLTLADALRADDDSDFDFEPPRLEGASLKVPTFE